MQIHFKSLNHDTSIAAFHRPSTPTTPTIMFRDPLIQIRAIKSDTLPLPLSHPFPLSLPTRPTARGAKVVQFNVIASKANVSKLATERMRARKRFKAVVDGVVRRSWGLRAGQSGADYLHPGKLPSPDFAVSHAVEHKG